MTFDDLIFYPHPDPAFGVRAVAEFANGYAASVIIGPQTHGGAEGCYEVGVMYRGKRVMVAGDMVLNGWMSAEDVTSAMKRIARLPPRDDQSHPSYVALAVATE